MRVSGFRLAALLLALAAYTGGGLAVDRHVGSSGQLVLGALTWLVLAAAGTQVAPERRLQVVLVVAIATIGEAVASLGVGLYTYRLDNLPSFVPPGHGIVYIAGMCVAGLAAGRERLLVGAAAAAAVGWGLAGLTVLPRRDVGGAVAAGVLVLVLLRSRRPVYAGVFAVVAALEVYGTAVGTWTWASMIPGTGISNGNPPSGVASGYVLLDVLAIAGAARIAAAWRPRATMRPCPTTT